MNLTQRMQEAKLRRHQMEVESRKRNKDYLVRWDIRRVEQERQREDYVRTVIHRKTKRTWLIIQALAYTFWSLNHSFKKRKHEKVLEEMRNFNAWKISYRYKLYLKRKVSDRRRNEIRRSLAFKAQTWYCAQIEKAKDIVTKVIVNYGEIKEIESKFVTVSRRLFMIQFRMRRFIRKKGERLQELRTLWAKTRDRLINDFMRSGREIKKELEKIAVIKNETIDLVLDRYYSKRFNEFALRFIRWRFSIYKSCSSEEYEGIFKRFELLKDQESNLFSMNDVLFSAWKLRKHDWIDYTIYDFSSMEIDIPNAPIRPRTPITNKFGKVIKSKNDDKPDPKTIAIISSSMPEFLYIPTIHELIMMYTKAYKIEQMQRKKSKSKKTSIKAAGNAEK